MIETPSYYLHKLTRKYLILRSGEIMLLSLGAAVVTYSLVNFLLLRHPFPTLLAIAAGSIVFVVRFTWLELHHLNTLRIINFINQHHKPLEDSADLLLKKPETLSSLQQLQQKKIAEKFNDIYPTVKLPHSITQSGIVLALSIFASVALTAVNVKNLPNKERVNGNRKETAPAVKIPADVSNVKLSITPPPYTGIPSTTTSDPQIKIPEGSRVAWEILFSDTVMNAQLIFSGADTLKLLRKKESFVTQRIFQGSNFYQLHWTTPSGNTKTSDYYSIEIIKDKAPDVSITSLPQFTQLQRNDKLTFDLLATLADDYGLQDAYIIATVSKGSGEAVKFREEKLKFTSPAAIQGQKLQARRTIDLLTLGMEAGDELYFYAEALDNKTPTPNRSRTETFFVVLQDTASENLSVEGGLGVDLMPEYFRSQRQIIIDTEKLLKQKKQISKQEFNATSNELGYDQKVLRLKYGQFLGEEFESGIAFNIQPDVHEDDDDKAVAEKYGHIHDKENEHNHVPDRKPESHQHAHTDANSEEKENPLDAFLHRHDSEEEATFFTQSIRAKLKAALTIMWDAELHLRLYEPEKSLPYQYKILKLLKEISNDSRIYVHKTGFDPPPLKEDKRLTADLSEIRSTNFQGMKLRGELYPGIRAALKTTETLLWQPARRLDEREKKVLLQGGNELSLLALQKPGQYLRALSLIKALTDDEIENNNIKATLVEIQNSFWKILPQQSASPNQEMTSPHSLNQSFIENLKTLKND